MKKTILAILLAVIDLAACTAGTEPMSAPGTLTAQNQPAGTASQTQAGAATTAPRGWYYSNTLVHYYDMEILSDNELWAIGDHATVYHGYPRPIWDATPYGYPGEFNFAASRELTAMDFISPDNGWLTVYPGGQIFHWNGQGWTMRKPYPSGTPDWYDIGFANNKLGWLVGCNDRSVDGEEVYPVLMQWNGVSWTNTALSGRINQNYCLRALEVVSAGDAWAVGERRLTEVVPIILLHWDGIQWQEFPTPPELHGRWRSISATGSSDVWLVSASEDRIAHWNGVEWILTDLPVGFQFEDEGPAVLALSQDNVWVGGRALFHWDGISWADAQYDTDHDYIVDLEADPDGHVWALTLQGGILRLQSSTGE